MAINIELHAWRVEGSGPMLRVDGALFARDHQFQTPLLTERDKRFKPLKLQ
jgi:hypothetical protein